MITRVHFKSIQECIRNNRIVLLSGPKMSGKKTIVDLALFEMGIQPVVWNAERKVVRNEFSEMDLKKIKLHLGSTTYLVIQEAQQLKNLQKVVEFVLGGELDVTIILCCSFRPNLDADLLEVLRIQRAEIMVYPLSFYELTQKFSLPKVEESLERYLIFGSYPLVVNDLLGAEKALADIVDHAIYAELGAGLRINKADRLLKVLQAAAFHIGEPVSYNELATTAGVDNETAERYIKLFEEAHLLIRVTAFHTEQRYELKKAMVIYFLDNGIRNALVHNLNPLEFRNDAELLWKNWLIAERFKWIKMNHSKVDFKVWWTHTKQYIDWLEFSPNGVYGFRTRWDKKKKVKYPKLFSNYYPEIKLQTLNRSTYWSYLMKR